MEVVETACQTYLCAQAEELTDAAQLLQIVQLGDHLGLATLCTAGAEALVKLPWHPHYDKISELLQLPFYKTDASRQEKLLLPWTRYLHRATSFAVHGFARGG